MLPVMNLPRLSELPNWCDFKRVALDTETRDDKLKELGPGVRRGGYITGISFCCGDENGPAFYLPIRHEGGGNYDDPARVFEYLRDMVKHYRGEIIGANLPYDLDYLAEAGVVARNASFRDIMVAGPLLDEPAMTRVQDKQTGRWFWGEEFHQMGLDAQCARWNVQGKDDSKLRAWAEEHGLNPKSDMWKAPAHIVSPYAVQDVRAPMALLAKQEREIEAQNLGRVYDMENRLLPVLVKMRRRGVAVDMDKLEQIDMRALNRELNACKEVARLTGREMSPDDTNKSAALAAILQADGVKVPLTEQKISAKTGKATGGQPSVTSPWLRTLGTPLAAAILDAKRWNKIRTTFCASIREHQVSGRIHCTFNQLKAAKEGEGDSDDGAIGAAFGRLSSSDPNLQQQPARDPEIGPMWRSIYQPDDGGKWACLDFSSQEPRLITHYAGLVASDPSVFMEENVRAAALAAEHACNKNADWDNHSMMASMMYDDYSQAGYLSGDKRMKGLRGDAKTIFLGLCYGMGGGKLARSLGLPTKWVVKDTRTPQWVTHEINSPDGILLRKSGARPFEIAGDEGQMLLDRFNARVPYVKALQTMVRKKAEKLGYILTLAGRRCRFPRNPETGKMEWAHKGLNRLVQGSAGDQTKMAMVLADEAGIRLQLQVHDELNFTFYDYKEAEQLNQIMVEAIPLRVPTRCDVETGASWGEIA